ncbi:MAG: hypothetical protein H6839_08385 [Planctomycetes bacterium]|nr:hypothetical protein [Planctomycetota bacterium]
MSGSGATSVSGIRAPSASRRGDTRRKERWTGGGIAVHIIILALAVLLWWIARDMVSVTQSLKDAGRVRFELSEDLRGEWRVFSQTSMPVSLEASGPTKEINDFASQLETTPGRFTYLYEITAADIANLQPDRRHLIQLTVDIRKFEATSEAVAPPELTVRPVVGSAGQNVFQVTLERFITRDATIDLGPAAKGQIQVQVKGSTKSRPYSYSSEARPTNPLEVRGPASLVEAITDPNGSAKIKVSVDALQALRNFASVNAQTEEQVLQQGSLVSNMQLLPIENVELRERYKDETGTEQSRPVSFVNVRITYTPLQDFVQVSREFAVEVVLPNWLVQKSARVENLPSNIQVDMKILGSQRPNFNEQNVHVRLDLSTLTRNELEIENVEGTTTKRAKVLNWYYSLDINTERLTYEFFNENVTAEQYLPIGEITIAWTE